MKGAYRVVDADMRPTIRPLSGGAGHARERHGSPSFQSRSTSSRAALEPRSRCKPD